VTAQAVPIIFTPSSPPALLSLLHRTLWMAVACLCLALFSVAASITPDPSGAGSHTQLHLQPCQFVTRVGIPCPTCGMTTSFAWFVRGNLLASLWVQPMGLALAIVVAMTFWLALYMAITGKPAWRLLSTIPGRIWVPAMMTLAVLAWGWKIFIHLHGIDGWK